MGMFTAITNTLICAGTAIYFAYDGNPIMFALCAVGVLCGLLNCVMEHTPGESHDAN